MYGIVLKIRGIREKKRVMYRVSENARTKKTAILICEGLEKCLETKPLNQIRINDIYKQCYVSRSTFYRLFDSIMDVLLYECDCIIKEIFRNYESMRFKTKTDKALFEINAWLARPKFAKAIVDNNLGWVISDSYRRNEELVLSVYQIKDISQSQRDYFYSFMGSLIFSSIYIYILSMGMAIF